MKKLVKVIAALLVAGAALAFTSCADGYGAFAPATPVTPETTTFTIDLKTTDPDYTVVTGASGLGGSTLAKIVAADPADATKEVVTYKIPADTGTAKSKTALAVQDNIKLTDNGATITLEKAGSSYTFKKAAN